MFHIAFFLTTTELDLLLVELYIAFLQLAHLLDLV